MTPEQKEAISKLREKWRSCEKELSLLKCEINDLKVMSEFNKENDNRSIDSLLTYMSNHKDSFNIMDYHWITSSLKSLKKE